MNFLAHFLLSHQTPEFIVGSYLGDFVKGKQYQNYSTEIRQGILLHREIDRYTDLHPVFLRSKRRLSPRHGHYAGVIVDMFYDHLLARHWTTYHSEPLPYFVSRIYTTLQQHAPRMPPAAQRVFGYMQAHDWLTNYAHAEGIVRALSGLQQRARFPNRMGQAGAALHQDRKRYEEEFTQFFPQLQQHVHRVLGMSK